MVAEVAGRPASLPLLSFTGVAAVADARSHGAPDHARRVPRARRRRRRARDLRRSRSTAASRAAIRTPCAICSRGSSPPTARASRRRAPSSSSCPARAGVLAHLIDARLLVVRDDDGDDIVEIVHECLAERWPRLARWRSEDAADRALLGDVRARRAALARAGRRADLLWRGEALAELRRLAARSTALTDDERAFADDAVARAEARAPRPPRHRRRRDGRARGGRGRDGVPQRRREREPQPKPRRSATKARDAAKLAEERLTASLIAQGQRELNDDRALAALAYFARGAASAAPTRRGCATMVSIASRGRRTSADVSRSRDVGVARRDRRRAGSRSATRRQRPFFDAGAHAREAETDQSTSSEIAPHARRRPASSRVRPACIVDDATTRSRTRSRSKGQPWIGVDSGPGADEITTVERRRASRSTASTASARRTTRARPIDRAAEPVFGVDATHACSSRRGRTIARVDLVDDEVARDREERLRRPSWQRSTDRLYAYLDQEHAMHLTAHRRQRGRQVLKPVDPRPTQIASRRARRSHRHRRRSPSSTIFDASGKQLRTFDIDARAVAFRCAATKCGPRATHGVIRHYQRRTTLVASMPAHIAPRSTTFALARDVNRLGRRATRRSSSPRADERSCKSVDKGPCTEPERSTRSARSATYACRGEPHARLHRPRAPRSIYPATASYVTSSRRSPAAASCPRSARGSRCSTRARSRLARLARTRSSSAPPTFEDLDHLLWSSRTRRRLIGWTIATEQLAATLLDDARAICGAIAIPGGPARRHGRQQAPARDRRAQDRATTAELGDRVGYLGVSPDRRWAGSPRERRDRDHRRLDRRGHAPVSSRPRSTGGVPMLRCDGRSASCAARACALTVWERASGDELIFGTSHPARDARGGRFTARRPDRGRRRARRSCSTSRAIPGRSPTSSATSPAGSRSRSTGGRLGAARRRESLSCSSCIAYASR